MINLLRTAAIGATVLLAGCATGGTTTGVGEAAHTSITPASPTDGAPAGPTSVYEGVFSETQAARGEAISEARCAACHSAEGEWGGGSLLLAYQGRPAWELVSMLRATMPMDAPGSLTLQEYADVTAYILAINGIPASATELPGDESGLRAVTLEYRR